MPVFLARVNDRATARHERSTKCEANNGACRQPIFVANLWQNSVNKKIVNYIGVVYNALVHRIGCRRRDETEKGCILRSISKTAWKTG